MGCVSAVPVPQPRATDAEAPAAAVTSARRSLAAALLLGAAGAAVVLLTAKQTWAEGKAAVVGGALPLEADGSEVTGLPTALAVVSLAALVAVFAVRGTGRVLVSAVLALSGAGAGAAALLATAGGGTLDEKAARTTGDLSAEVAGLTHTAWPYVSAAGALLLLLAGLLALRHGKYWPAMSGRYERDGTPRARRAHI
ncbi:TIGR02234 family membrane protein, partial [Streptomyces clavuligerus]|uniref:TIGR02234 family membrane protein n=1 Tax=Streptomyces clavuligerus TaxID=1901 RepID=UPI0018CFFD49